MFRVVRLEAFKTDLRAAGRHRNAVHARLAQGFTAVVSTLWFRHCGFDTVLEPPREGTITAAPVRDPGWATAPTEGVSDAACQTDYARIDCTTFPCTSVSR
jgi:hypothetical protein